MMSNDPIDQPPIPQEPLPRRRSGAGDAAAESGQRGGRQAYNVVTDTVAGPNLRLKDNVFQAVFIGVCVLIAVPVGALFGGIGGALAGALGALIIGVILSGAILGVYRAVRHMQGKHD
jgi:hypothetical protein